MLSVNLIKQILLVLFGCVIFDILMTLNLIKQINRGENTIAVYPAIKLDNSCWWINVRENQRGNQEWIIQRHWQHWAQDTEQKQTKRKRWAT